mgnify:CR=1 FL=1
MMTRERELLQQALDALDRAISDDRAYIRECKDAAEAIRAHLAAQPAPGEPVALESVHLTRDIKGMCTVRVNGRVAIQDNGDIIDHMATLEWFAQPAACGWSQDGDSYSDTWATSCGHYFRLDDGTPTDNKMAFCCYCGKSLVSYPFVEDEDE